MGTNSATTTDKTLALRQLEISKNVKIDVIEAKSLLRVIGHKYNATEAVEEVEAILYKPFDVELDVEPLKVFSRLGALSEDAIQQMATPCGCTVKWKDRRTHNIVSHSLDRGVLQTDYFSFKFVDETEIAPMLFRELSFPTVASNIAAKIS